MLHVLADGTLYQIDLDSDDQTVLAENLSEDQYAVSDDGQQMAYQTSSSQEDNSEDDADAAQTGICVMNLKSGDTYTIDAADGETLRPLGFINGDFVFGGLSGSLTGTLYSENLVRQIQV